MPATKITDLLPVPPGIRQPHPYQVLGLDDGEQDSETIKRAIKRVVAKLKAAQSQADPTLWKQAAVMVKEAQKILSDPQQKAQLDARFGIVPLDLSEDATSPSPGDALAAFLPPADPLATHSADPLAAVLPASDPLTPADVVTDAVAANDAVAGVAQSEGGNSVSTPIVPTDSGEMLPNAMPPGLFGTPEKTDGPTVVPPSSPVVVKTPPTRRKRSMAATILFLTFAFGSFGVIGALVYFLLFGPGQVSITKADGGISISTQPPTNSNSAIVSEPRSIPPSRDSRPRDPIMGDLAGVNPSTTPLGRPSGVASPFSPQDSDPLPESNSIPDDPTADVSSPNSDSEAMPDLAGMLTPMEPTASPDTAPVVPPSVVDTPSVTPEMTGTETEASEQEMIAAAERTLDEVRRLIRSARWKEMKPAAEAALNLPMSEMQKEQAQDLFELADLATYYRTGIEKAVADLKVGNDFEVTDDFRVIIVETGEDQLVVRYNAQNRDFRFDEFPWSLAHKLATFSMPDDATSRAAKAVYQAIAPKTTEAYRQEALGWLSEIQDELEGADPQRLAETIRGLFEET